MGREVLLLRGVDSFRTGSALYLVLIPDISTRMTFLIKTFQEFPGELRRGRNAQLVLVSEFSLTGVSCSAQLERIVARLQHIGWDHHSQYKSTVFLLRLKRLVGVE